MCTFGTHLFLSIESEVAEPSTGGLLEGMGLDGDSLAPMETDESTSTDTKSKSKLTPAMATRIKQIKPLLSGELIKFFSKVSEQIQLSCNNYCM